jgi:hypothetical protein
MPATKEDPPEPRAATKHGNPSLPRQKKKIPVRFLSFSKIKSYSPKTKRTYAEHGFRDKK